MSFWPVHNNAWKVFAHEPWGAWAVLFRECDSRKTIFLSAPAICRKFIRVSLGRLLSVTRCIWETTWMEARGKRKFNASWPLAACGLSYMCRHFALIIRLRLLIVNCLVIRLGEDARSLLQLIILLSGRHSTKRPRTVPGIVRNILNNYRSASENRLRTNSRTYSESVSKQHRESL